jgi:hypothetical protein
VVVAATSLAVAGVALAIPMAHADPTVVRPGLTCDDIWGVINCTNDTDTDSTVLQTKQCAAGTWSTTEYDSEYDYTTHTSTSQPKLVFHSTDAQSTVANVFVAAHSSALGANGCDHDTAGITYAIAQNQ